MARRITALVVGALLLAAAPALAQTPSPRPTDTLGWHLVRPGETLEGITERYLGTPVLWRENWRHNPQVKNPHLLHPGDRLRVILARALPPRTAEVRRVARRVEAKPNPNPWIPARTGDLLRERDGVRTFRRSSAELGFDDGTTLRITESSLIFLRQVQQTLVGTTRDTIEIVDGQADLEARPRRAGAADLEVLVGGATVAPEPGRTGVAASRARKVPDGGAQLMVFGGRARVEAAGAAVEVPAGMGTAVPKGKPPAPPEKLLPAPKLLRPQAGAQLAWANPTLVWARVEGAMSYTAEVCRDAACGALIDRRVGLTVSSWRPGALPEGQLFWRVTAVAGSGLDGYPSRARRLRVTGGPPDREAPVVVIVPGEGTRVVGKRVVARPGGVLKLAAHDDASGVASIKIKWDGGVWHAAPATSVRVPDSGGAHRLAVRATDRAGHASTEWTVAVDVDDAAPAPPALQPPPPVQEREEGR